MRFVLAILILFLVGGFAFYSQFKTITGHISGQVVYDSNDDESMEGGE